MGTSNSKSAAGKREGQEGRADPTPSDDRRRIAWYHGSPMLLTSLRPGSSVTPVLDLARAFARNPRTVCIEVDGTQPGHIVKVSGDGHSPGYVYQVMPKDQAVDLKVDAASFFPPDLERVTVRELPLLLIEKLRGLGRRRPARAKRGSGRKPS